MSPETRALLDAVAGMAAVGSTFEQEDGLVPAVAEPAAYHVAAAAPAAPVQMTTSGTFVTGPFPAAFDVPAGYAPRATGGWLTANPVVGGNTTTTYWTPNGTTAATAAVTTMVEANGVATTDMVTAPWVAVSDVPSFFKAKLTLPGAYTVQQAEETYKVYTNGSVKGTARGYRWQVSANGVTLAWIRSHQITQADGTQVDHWEITSDYQTVAGKLTATKSQYGSYWEATQTGNTMSRTLNAATGVVTGTGTWQNVAGSQSVAIDDVFAADGSLVRKLTRTLPDGRAMVVTETYGTGNAGTGTVAINGLPVGALTWGAYHRGTVTIDKASEAYVASRRSTIDRPQILDLPAPVVATPVTTGVTTYDSQYNGGDVFAGAAWSNSRNTSAFVNREFDGTYLVSEVYIGDARSDASYGPASSIYLKLKLPNGTWSTVKSWTNKNLSKETVTLPTAVAATQLRLEMNGHGWFSGSNFTMKGVKLNPMPAPAAPVAMSYGANRYVITTGTTSYDSQYSGGDVFAGASWSNAKNTSAFVNREFGGTYSVKDVFLGSMGSDASYGPATTTTIKLRKPDNTWVTVQTLTNTNLSNHTLELPTAIPATALRVEQYGHGWFAGSNFMVRAESGATPVADPARDFSATTQDVNGWSYLGVQGATTQALVPGANNWGDRVWLDARDTSKYLNLTASGDTVTLHPSLNAQTRPILRWTAPESRSYTLDASVFKANTDCGEGATLKITANTTTLATLTMGYNDTIVRRVGRTFALSKGQTLSFELVTGANSWCDAVSLKANIR